jgi:hypothetical protein
MSGLKAKKNGAKEILPKLTDERLRALAFHAWRVEATGNERRRKKASLLTPLVRAELAAREARKASASRARHAASRTVQANKA